MRRRRICRDGSEGLRHHHRYQRLRQPHRNLEFAVKDAADMAFALQQIKDYEVVSVSLLSKRPRREQ